MVSKSQKNKLQRLRKLARQRADIGVIKKIKDRRTVNGIFEYLIEWQGTYPDTWHREEYHPNISIQIFKDECVRFITRRHMWQHALFEK
jgi:hypothetical protein